MTGLDFDPSAIGHGLAVFALILFLVWLAATLTTTR